MKWHRRTELRSFLVVGKEAKLGGSIAQLQIRRAHAPL